MQLCVVGDHTVPWVSVRIVLARGSLMDPSGAEGLAVLTADSLLLGAGDLAREAWKEALDHLGAEVDVHVARDVTIVGAEVLARNAEALFALLGDLVHRARIEEQDVARLKRQSIADIDQLSDDDESLVSSVHAQVLWGSHPYARPSRGWSETLRGIECSDLREFHYSRVVEGPLLVAVAGDVREADVRAWSERAFTASSEPILPPVQLPAPVVVPGRNAIWLEKPGRTQTRVLLGCPTIGFGHADLHALQVANTVLGGLYTGRLMQELRERRGWTYDVQSQVGVGHRGGAFSIAMGLDADQGAAGLACCWELLETWIAEGISLEELQFAQSHLLNSFAFARETASQRLGHALEVALHHRPSDWLDGWCDRIRAVNVGDVQRALHAHLNSADMLMTLVARPCPELREFLGEWARGGSLRVHPAAVEFRPDVRSA